MSTQKRIIYFTGEPASEFQQCKVNTVAHRLGASFAVKKSSGLPMAYVYKNYRMIGIVTGPNSETLWEKKITDLLNTVE